MAFPIRYQEKGSELDLDIAIRSLIDYKSGVTPDPRINMDPDADEYVQDIFGNQYTVIDNVESLPEKLPQLFMALTK